MRSEKKEELIFPKWTNVMQPAVAVAALGGVVYVTVLVWLGFSPKAVEVGYQPEQPVPYSHALHVGQLGVDCRYCHTSVEVAAEAAVPPTQTCMNCHSSVRTCLKRSQSVRVILPTDKFGKCFLMRLW